MKYSSLPFSLSVGVRDMVKILILVEGRFVPYLALHEFEAMLFAQPTEIRNGFGQPGLGPLLEKIRASFPTPEDINDHKETAPSRRLGKLFPAYNISPFTVN